MIQNKKIFMHIFKILILIVFKLINIFIIYIFKNKYN
jgi:hypothetical protein